MTPREEFGEAAIAFLFDIGFRDRNERGVWWFVDHYERLMHQAYAIIKAHTGAFTDEESELILSNRKDQVNVGSTRETSDGESLSAE